MDYFPAFLQLDDKPCLLVGGGAVAARKAKALLTAGATLTMFVSVPILLVAVCVTAALIPAWRASRVDPVEVLRAE